MKRRIAVAPVVAALLCLTAACTGGGGGDGDHFRFSGATPLGTTLAPADRKAARDFSGELLSGGGFELSEDAGKVVVVNFWASWCPPCQVETPQFDSVYRAYSSRDVAFVGIDFKDPRGDATHFVADNHISYPIVYDQQGKVAVQLGNLPAQGLPFTVLIDKRQRVAAVYIHTLAPKDLEPVLDKLLLEPVTAPAASPTR